MLIGEIKKILEEVPDDFEAIIELEGVDVEDVDVNYEKKTKK